MPTTAPRPFVWWWAALGVGVLVAGAAAAMRLRRSRPMRTPTRRAAAIEPAIPLAVPAPRARLSIALRPTRAGLTIISATVDAEIVVTNDGDLPATDIRVAMTLLAAHAAQDAALAEVFTRPVGRPAVPAFTLAPGESRAVRAVAALPREGLVPLTAAGRPMVVPLAAITCLYDSGEGRGQTSQAFVIGIERVDSARLAPFWLDAPPRMHDHVAARAQGPIVRR